MAAAASTESEGASGLGNLDIEGWHDVDKEHYACFKRHRAEAAMELPVEANLKVKAGVKKQRRENRQRRNATKLEEMEAAVAAAVLTAALPAAAPEAAATPPPGGAGAADAYRVWPAATCKRCRTDEDGIPRLCWRHDPAGLVCQACGRVDWSPPGLRCPDELRFRGWCRACKHACCLIKAHALHGSDWVEKFKPAAERPAYYGRVVDGGRLPWGGPGQPWCSQCSGADEKRLGHEDPRSFLTEMYSRFEV